MSQVPTVVYCLFKGPIVVMLTVLTVITLLQVNVKQLYRGARNAGPSGGEGDGGAMRRHAEVGTQKRSQETPTGSRSPKEGNPVYKT